MSREGRLQRAFGGKRAALIAYLMAGYPSHEGALEALRETAAAGADVIELGVPYGDALADGPVIVRAANAAMSAAPEGFGLAESLALAREFLADPGVEDAPPLLLMTYVNPVRKMGFESVARLASEAGISGFIIPDLPPDNPMAEEWLAQAAKHGLDTVFLVAPTSTPDRMITAATASSGFLYCVSTTGVTGERAEIEQGLSEMVERVRVHTDLPVAVGFGVSTPEQAAHVAHIADGVVVGSAIVKRQTDPRRTGEFVTALVDAIADAAE